MRIPLKTISRKWEYYTQTTFGHTHSLSVSHIYHISQNCNQIWESEWEHTNNTHTFNTPISPFEYWIISRNNTKITVVEKTKAKSKIKLKHLAKTANIHLNWKKHWKKHTHNTVKTEQHRYHTQKETYTLYRNLFAKRNQAEKYSPSRTKTNDKTKNQMLQTNT